MQSIYKSAAHARVIARRYQDFLKLWPQPNRQFTVATGQGDTFVISCGADGAPPLLLLHGSGSNCAMWIGDAASWAAQYKLYAIDLIGEPGSSAASRPPLKSDAYANWLDEVLLALGIERFSMVGASLGGWLAIDYATRNPGRIERLVLLAPGGIGRQRLSFLFKVMPLLLLGNWGRKRAMRLAMGPPNEKASTGQQSYIDFMLLVQRYFRPRMGRLPMLSDASLSRLHMPLLAVLGGKDAILDSAHTKERLESSVASANILYLPDIGHGMLGEKAAILQFLDRQSGARG